MKIWRDQEKNLNIRHYELCKSIKLQMSKTSSLLPQRSYKNTQIVPCRAPIHPLMASEIQCLYTLGGKLHKVEM